MTPPPPRMADCLNAIERLTVDGVPPSWSQLGRELNLAQSNIHRLLSDMKDRGLVDWKPRRAHTLRILGQEPDFASMSTPALTRILGHVEALLANRSMA